MSTVLVTGANGFVGSHLVPALVDAGHHVLALVRDDDGAAQVQRRLTPAQRASVEIPAWRRDEAGLAARRARRGGGRPPPGGDRAGLGWRRHAPPRQHGGDPKRPRRVERGGRPALRPSRRSGRHRRPVAPLRELEGKGDGPRARKRPRLDDPQPVAAVRAAGRVLQHPRRPRAHVAGHRADHRQGRRPLPAARHRGPREGGRAGAGRRRHHRQGVPAGWSPPLDLSRDRRGGPARHGQAAHARPHAGRPDPPRGGCRRSGPPPVPRRHGPAPPAELDNTGPLDCVRTGFGFEPQPMEGALTHLRRKARDQEPAAS